MVAKHRAAAIAEVHGPVTGKLLLDEYRRGGDVPHCGCTRCALPRVPRAHGHAWVPESAITRPRSDGKVDVVLVDARGNVTRTLMHAVPYRVAVGAIRMRHG